MQLLGSLGIAVLALAVGSQILQYLWLLGILSLLWFLMAAAAFVLAIVAW